MRIRKISNLIFVGFAWWALVQTTATAQPSKNRNALQSVQKAHRERYREFASEIAKLEENCNGNDLPDAVKQVHARLIPPDTLSFRNDKLPTEVQPEIPVSLPQAEREWRAQLRRIERDYARDLYVQSRKALKQGCPSYAYDLVREVALHDPDHAQTRKILGYVRLEKEWVTQAASAQIKLKNVWNDKFGWIPRAHEQRYLNNERFCNGRWMPPEKEGEIRRDFESAWEIRTDHYLIKTNVSLEKGVELGRSLEDFYETFRETFIGFFHTPEQLQKLLEGVGKTNAVETTYVVHFYRSREEYNERLAIFFPNIKQTNGVFMIIDGVAHFYDDPENDHAGTLYHEGTHQLFYQSSPDRRTICEDRDFWIIEGIACYMESFQQRKSSAMLGDPKYVRFAGARHNLLRENYYLPLRKFSSMGMQDFQTAPNLAKNYNQAAGLARFFMQYDDGRYRDALVRHLAQLYSNDAKKRDHAESLEELTGVEFEELDRQYAEDARQVEASLAR